MSVLCEEPWKEVMYETTLTKDEQMFIFRWYPTMGGVYCSKELGVSSYSITAFAKRLHIPKMQTEYVMTCSEIATKLDMSTVEVQMIFDSGMRKLREAFKDNLKARQLLKDLE